MDFKKILNQTQKQIEIDKKIYKETGCKSDFLMRAEAVEKSHINKGSK